MNRKLEKTRCLNKPIYELEFSMRTSGILDRMGIKTVRQLTRVTRNQLLKQQYMKPKFLAEIEEILGEMDLRLRRPQRYNERLA